VNRERIYDGSVLAGWETPTAAGVCPDDPAERARWGWRQDDEGRWYREVPAGADWTKPPLPEVHDAPAPGQ
jgi:hypothetical protein